jgi:hypothetical protein
MRLLCACYASAMRPLCARYASAMRLLCGCYAGVCRGWCMPGGRVAKHDKYGQLDSKRHQSDPEAAQAASLGP